MAPPPSPDGPAALRREVLRLAWPVVLQNLSRTMMFLVDTLMIGRLGPEAMAMALGGGLRGAGDTRSPVVAAVVGVWLVRVPLSWALAFPAGLGLTGIWITMIADGLARTVFFEILCRRGRWKRLAL